MDHIKQKKKVLAKKIPISLPGPCRCHSSVWLGSLLPSSLLSQFPWGHRQGRADTNLYHCSSGFPWDIVPAASWPGNSCTAGMCRIDTSGRGVSQKRTHGQQPWNELGCPSWTHLDLCRSYGAWLWLALTLQTALVRAGNSLHPLRTQPPAASCGPRAAPETTGTRKKSQPLHYFFCCFIPPVRCLCRSWPTAAGFGRSTRGHHQTFPGAGAGFPHQRATFQRKGCREHRCKQQKPLSFWLCSGLHSKDERQTWALQRLN